MGEPKSKLQAVLIRRLCVLFIGAFLMWGAVVIGLSGIARSGNPELALRISPTDSRAMTYLADRLLIGDPTALRAERPRQLARAALLNDPTNVAALRILGFSAPPKDQRAIFELSNRLSRRDFATQLWLIDYHVGREDAASALAHYDAALRTSAMAPQLLFPVLAKASEDKTLAPQIGDILAKQPPWANGFLNELLFSAPSPDTLLVIYKHFMREGAKLLPSQADGLKARMVRDERFDLLQDAYFVAGGTDKVVGLRVKNGSFSSDPSSLPFDWQFSPNGDLFAGRTTSDTDANNFRIAVQAPGGSRGEAAKQLLMLAPGQYSLVSTSGSVPSAPNAILSWQLICANKGGVKLLEIGLSPSSNTGSQTKSEFRVPATNCPAQWLSLQVVTPMDGEELNAWIDDVVVKRLN